MQQLLTTTRAGGSDMALSQREVDLPHRVPDDQVPQATQASKDKLKLHTKKTITIKDNDKRKSPFRCQMAVSGAPHDISHEEEVRGRLKVKK